MAKNQYASRIAALIVATTTGLSAMGSVACGQPETKGTSPNGFDLSHSLIPRDEIFGGGPQKDGIPALTNPAVLRADRAHYLRPTDMVVGVMLGGEPRAYPLRILDWHENVNDVVGEMPIAVSFCPLCRSALVFDRRIGDTLHEFGNSGLLWNSKVLVYDRHSETTEESKSRRMDGIVK